MEFSWPVFAVMLLLGALQLAVGVVLGRCLPVRSPNAPSDCGKPVAEPELDPRRLRFFASRLMSLVGGMSGEVGKHRSEIAEVSRELADARGEDAHALTDSVLRSIARIVAVNERLQNRLESAEERLQQQNEQIEAHFTESRTDPLTGLMNRRAFDDALSFQAEQGSRPFALMMIDVDHFKELNDEHGHPAGDQALRAISQRLENLLAGSGMVARYGGEEFAVILPAVNVPQAEQIAERLRLAVTNAPFTCEQSHIPISVSLGVTRTDPGTDPFVAFKRADEALYTAKRSGRNCAFFHDGQQCRRIEFDAEHADRSLTAGSHGALPEARANSSKSGKGKGEDDFEEISADLRQRMLEVAISPTPSSGGTYAGTSPRRQ